MKKQEGNVFDITLPPVEIPEYDYQERVNRAEPEARDYRAGSIFENMPLGEDPVNLTLVRCIDEILDI